MPFTPTHIAAIVPVAAICRRVPFSALAIGSMIPDLPLFFHWVTYAQTHSPVGVLTVCMPLGLAAFVIFQSIIKTPTIAFLPNWLQQRITTYSSPCLEPSYRFFLTVAVAIVIGAYTHIVWDAFTHQGRWGTRLVPLINTNFLLAGRLVPGYKILQFGSSFVFLPLLLLLLGTKLWRTEPEGTLVAKQMGAPAKLFNYALLLGIPALVAIPRLMATNSLERKLFFAVTSSGAMFAILIFAYSLLYLILTKRIAARPRSLD